LVQTPVAIKKKKKKSQWFGKDGGDGLATELYYGQVGD
jgi:hypothetical protein